MAREWLAPIVALVALTTNAGAQIVSPHDAPADFGAFFPPAEWAAPLPDFLANGLVQGAPPVEQWTATPPAFLVASPAADAPPVEAGLSATLPAFLAGGLVAGTPPVELWAASPPAFLAEGVAPSAPVAGQQTTGGPAAGAAIDASHVAQWTATPPAFLSGGLVPATPPAFLTQAAAPQAAGPCANMTEGANAIGRFHFFAGSARLNEAARSAIPQVAARLKQCPELRVEVGGHADTIGSAEANMELAKRRATAIIRALERQGIDGHRLYWRSYGFSMPIASNDTAAGRALNRRIDIVVR